ncbi:MAG TPA: hypothetical protein VLL48_01895 [Longimicrobiales bacterium]|nr:hypothetical protein [Longimicrobiales bacterium]
MRVVDRLRGPVALAVAVPLAIAAWGTRLPAQTVRVEGVTSLRYVQIRPLQEDSIPVGETEGDGLLRRTRDGRLVRCISGQSFCHYYRAGERTATTPGIQDLMVSGWGVGQGVRVYAHLRARTDLSDPDGLWPRSDDPFDVLAAYVEIDRDRFRVRAGRNWLSSGLGFYDYDGVAALLRVSPRITAEAWGGWSLIRGTPVPSTDDALSAIEPFAPDERAVLLGARLGYRAPGGLAVAGLYQREIRTDRAALYSERTALDVSWALGRLSLDGSLEADLVARQVNEARIDARFAPDQSLTVGVFARRYRPFFELWTIWGAFAPVGFDEVGADAFWRRPGAPLTLRLGLSRRAYDDTGAELTFAPLRDDGWRVTGSADLRIDPRWSVQGGLHHEVGAGAGITEGHLRARRTLGAGGWVAAGLTAFQRAFEFRVHEGTVWGLSLDAGHRLDTRTRISGSISAYRHGDSSESPGVDWSQVRGGLRLEWTVGPEPGLAPPGEDVP